MKKAENTYLKSLKPEFLFIVLLLYTLPMAASIDNGNIHFTLTNFTSDTPSIEFENDATASGGAIELITNQNGKALIYSVGRATYYQPMHLWDNSSGNLRLVDFTTQFSFAINSLNKSFGDGAEDDIRADGFAFFLAPYSSKIPPNSVGACLGLQTCDSDANSKFVAVEFDTFRNLWDPPTMSDHVAIDLNSLKASFHPVEWLWNDIENGGKVDAFITYNSCTKNHLVFLQYWILVYIYQNGSLLASPDPLDDYLSYTLFILGISVQLTVLAIAGGIFALLLILGLALLFCKKRKYRRMREDGTMSVNVDMEMVTAPRKFSYRELSLATNNFDDKGLLREGGFGKVYLGFLRDINSNIAIKRITPNSQQWVKEYESEITTIIRLRQRNLVQLIGWCHDNKEFLIVSEFLPNKSLDYHLHREPCLLTWDTRYKIAIGVASTLFYMEKECDQCVLHRDIKSSNVLLELSYNAKLGEFGLARLVDHGQRSQTTKLILGTDGYIAPECLETYKAIKESNIYSFALQDNIVTSSTTTSSYTSASRRSQTQSSGTVSSIHSFKGKTMAPGYDTEAKQ
ncbi:hypothetical protein Gotur_020773 [Gossypium turneri]